MPQPLKILTALLLFCLLAADGARCQAKGNCPVLPTLAASRLPSEEGESVVIWYLNDGGKTIRGVQFELVMLDAVGNRYPAAQKYIASGTVKPQNGDVVIYPTDKEKEHFGADWTLIEGVEVRVTRVMFQDGSVWVPQKGQVCMMRFMNDEYDAEMERRRKAVEKKMQRRKEKN
jgi:hypothetical protein